MEGKPENIQKIKARCLCLCCRSANMPVNGVDTGNHAQWCARDIVQTSGHVPWHVIYMQHIHATHSAQAKGSCQVPLLRREDLCEALFVSSDVRACAHRGSPLSIHSTEAYTLVASCYAQQAMWGMSIAKRAHARSATG